MLKIKTCSKDAAGRMFHLTNLRHVVLSVILESLLHVCGFLSLVVFHPTTDVGKIYSTVCIIFPRKLFNFRAFSN